MHPLVLQGWVKAFGPSEASTRGLSVVCGLLTVAWIGRIGRRTFDDVSTGLWAAWLAALSPLLVVYSREARMYAWLVLVTCAAWDALLSLRPRPGRLGLYALGLAALVYSHPLGLLMAATLALASLVNRRAFGLSWWQWLAAHLLGAMTVAPWASRYFDHDPESTVGRLSVRFLLGLPIGFIGGNFLTLVGFVGLTVYGLARRGLPHDARPPNRVAVSCLLLWLTVPPVLLYAYSWVSHPVFGPARYTLFVAPAFLILVAGGLARLPRLARGGVGLFAACLSVSLYPSLIFAPDLKADWRGAAPVLDRLDPGRSEPVVVVATDPAYNVEVVTARYYLGPDRLVVAAPPLAGVARGRYWLASGIRGGRGPAEVPEGVRPVDLPGLRLIPIGTR